MDRHSCRLEGQLHPRASTAWRSVSAPLRLTSTPCVSVGQRPTVRDWTADIPVGSERASYTLTRQHLRRVSLRPTPSPHQHALRVGRSETDRPGLDRRHSCRLRRASYTLTRQHFRRVSLRPTPSPHQHALRVGRSETDRPGLARRHSCRLRKGQLHPHAPALGLAGQSPTDPAASPARPACRSVRDRPSGTGPPTFLSAPKRPASA